MNTTADSLYAERAARRLKKLLDEQGFPLDTLGRSVALSRLLLMSEATAIQVMSGKVPWDWDTVQKVCKSFDKQPGYLLDDVPAEGMPSDVRIVTSVAGGEAIVWRMPTGFYGTPVTKSSELRYLVDSTPSADGAAISLHVFEQRAIGRGDLTIGTIYVVESEEGYSLMTFTSVKGQLACFSSRSEASEVLIAMSSNDEPGENASLPRVAGQLLGSIGLAHG